MRHNIYLPDELSRAVQDAGIAMSAVCQNALKEEVEKVNARMMATTELEQVAARLRETQNEEDSDLQKLGHEIGVRWAQKWATMRDLTEMTDAYQENWIAWRPRKDNGIWESLNEGDEGDEDATYSYQRDVVDVENWPSNPFLSGVVDGAIEVYNAVRPLV